MEKKDIHNVLREIIPYFDKEDKWRVEGSANLKIQGIETYVKDLDLVVSLETFRKLKKKLGNKILSDKFIPDKGKFVLILNIKGFEVEIIRYYDQSLEMLDRILEEEWWGIRVRILPLKYAREVYQKVGMIEKVQLIDSYTKK
ncbi:Uncharacterised protein [uncultured archaeon]|nr:Uncharacterised protein [uncultured archaeon]